MPACRMQRSAPSEIITDFLWLSSANSALDESVVGDLGITHIVNATNRCVPNMYEKNGVAYLNVDIDDDESASISSHFKSVEEFLNTAQSSSTTLNPSRCLVHCMVGVSRSATLVIAYLMLRSSSPSLREIFNDVKSRREIIAPNPRFARELMQLELELNETLSQNTITEEEMISPNYRRSQNNAIEARKVLDGLSSRSTCSVS